MSSLYWGAALKGIGDAGGVLGNAMYQDIARDERLKAIEDEKRKDRELRLEIAQMREQGSTSRAAGKNAPGGVLSFEDIATGGKGEEYLAQRAGMSIPELRKFREAERSGDYSGYGEDQTVRQDADPANSDAVSRRNTVKRTALPPDFEAFKAKKRAELASAMEMGVYGEDYEKLAKGRQAEAETGILTGAAKGDQGARDALLASKGKDSRETTARADYFGSRADLADRTDPNLKGKGGAAKPTEKLTQEAETLRKAIKQLRDAGGSANRAKADAYQTQLDEVMAELKSRRGGAPAPAPAAATPAKPADAKANVAALRAKANAAIAAGKNRAAVAARFKEMTGETL